MRGGPGGRARGLGTRAGEGREQTRPLVAATTHQTPPESVVRKAGSSGRWVHALRPQREIPQNVRSPWRPAQTAPARRAQPLRAGTTRQGSGRVVTRQGSWDIGQQGAGVWCGRPEAGPKSSSKRGAYRLQHDEGVRVSGRHDDREPGQPPRRSPSVPARRCVRAGRRGGWAGQQRTRGCGRGAGARAEQRRCAWSRRLAARRRSSLAPPPARSPLSRAAAAGRRNGQDDRGALAGRGAGRREGCGVGQSWTPVIEDEVGREREAVVRPTRHRRPCTPPPPRRSGAGAGAGAGAGGTWEAGSLHGGRHRVRALVLLRPRGAHGAARSGRAARAARGGGSAARAAGAGRACPSPSWPSRFDPNAYLPLGPLPPRSPHPRTYSPAPAPAPAPTARRPPRCRAPQGPVTWGVGRGAWGVGHMSPRSATMTEW
jgi:hypothetical protein